MMDILYQRGSATATEILEQLPDPPSYSAVRAKLRVLEEKGHIRHEEESLHYVYFPTVARDTARRSGMEHGMAAGYNRLEELLLSMLAV